MKFLIKNIIANNYEKSYSESNALSSDYESKFICYTDKVKIKKF